MRVLALTIAASLAAACGTFNVDAKGRGPSESTASAAGTGAVAPASSPAAACTIQPQAAASPASPELLADPAAWRFEASDMEWAVAMSSAPDGWLLPTRVELTVAFDAGAFDGLSDAKNVWTASQVRGKETSDAWYFGLPQGAPHTGKHAQKLAVVWLRADARSH